VGKFNLDRNVTVELIPVIEIGYSNQGTPVPDKYPYWNYPDIWDRYHEENFKRANFKDKLKSYLPGSSFFKLADISNDNLTKLTTDHTEEMRNGKYDREQACPFFGGYVLRINGNDKYFPQCCGDLSDIQYWKHLLTQDDFFFYQGHPAPIVKVKGDKVTFDFTVGENGEHFAPTPPDLKLEIDRKDLKIAIDKLITELNEFADRVRKVNIEQELNILDIDKLLVWGEN
jgi:hypothetical protein